jgi:hypothetical protein
MKKIVNIIAIIAIFAVLNGCKKENSNTEVKSETITKEMFYKIEPNANKIIQKVVNFIKNTDRYQDLNEYVKKFGYPNWNKAIIQAKTSNVITEDVNNNPLDYYLIVPTILPNQAKITGFIAIDIVGNLVQFSTKLASNYKNYPYESANISGVTAEDILSCYLVLEKQVFEMNKFLVSDELLAFYKVHDNTKGLYYLQLGSDESGTIENDRICYWERWVYSTANGDIPLSDWVPIFCWKNSIINLAGSLDEGAGGGSSGGSGSGNPPPPPLTDEEICNMKFQNLAHSTIVASEPHTGMGADIDPNNRQTYVRWLPFTNSGGWVTETYWEGKLYRHKLSDPWKWTSFTFDKINVAGVVTGGTVGLSLTNSNVHIDNLGKYATIRVTVLFDYKTTCFGVPHSVTESFIKLYISWCR